jgi:hypothetical protein
MLLMVTRCISQGKQQISVLANFLSSLPQHHLCKVRYRDVPYSQPLFFNGWVGGFNWAWRVVGTGL